MGRRQSTMSRAPTERASLGDSHVEYAETMINQTCQRAMATMLHYTPSRHETINMLFTPGTIQRARAAHGIINPSTHSEDYPVTDYCHLNINYNESGIPTIVKGMLRLQPPAAGALLTFVGQARDIYRKYEEVKAVLKWLNRNATPGAIRYFWPTAMKLCPASPIWRDLQDVPSRYDIPNDMSLWSQSIKDAAGTWAGSLMLPSDAKTRERKSMWLTFQPYKVTNPVNGASQYMTDTITFNL